VLRAPITDIHLTAKIPLVRGTRTADMRTPRGCLRRLTAKMMRLARAGDVEGFRAYLRSNAFLMDFTGLDPGRRQSAMRCYWKATTMCEAKASHPLVEPRPIDAKRSHKVNWSDPAMRAKLAAAYAAADGDNERAARVLGVSVGSARLAKKRHLHSATADLGKRLRSEP
jgi:hypothetical protein